MKVAILDFGFADWSAAQAAGEVPPPADQYNLFLFPDTDLPVVDSGVSSHGTGTAKALFDLAPGAKIHLMRVPSSIVDNAATMAQAEAALAAWGIDVVVLSLGDTIKEYEFFDGSGPTAAAINASPRLWFFPAGNDARQHFKVDGLATAAQTNLRQGPRMELACE